MNWRCAIAPRLMFTGLVMLFGFMASAHAVNTISVDDLQAAMRTLGFLESLPKNGVIVVGIVYSPDTPNSKALATETANFIGATLGPNSRVLRPEILSTTDLAQFQNHLDVMFLVEGASNHSQEILSAVRRLHVVSISSDRVCLDTKCCVLMVSTGQRVEITLNTALADAVGARFSMVFTMVVKRK